MFAKDQSLFLSFLLARSLALSTLAFSLSLSFGIRSTRSPSSRDYINASSRFKKQSFVASRAEHRVPSHVRPLVNGIKNDDSAAR